MRLRDVLIVLGSLCIFMGLSASLSYGQSQSLRVITIEHRDAVDLQQALRSLLPENASVSVDANHLLVRAPQAEMGTIIRAVKSLDKPQAQLKVSVFRGKHPQQLTRTISTTSHKQNRLWTVNTANGQLLILNETGLLPLSTANVTYANNRELTALSAPVTPSSVQITTSEGLQLVDPTTLATEGSELGVITVPNNNNPVQGESASSKVQQWREVNTGVQIRAVLSGKQQIQVSTLASVPSNKLVAEEGITSLMTQVSQSALIELGQWHQLSEQETFSHQAPIKANRKIHSTGTSTDQSQSLWVKVEKVK